MPRKVATHDINALTGLDLKLLSVTRLCNVQRDDMRFDGVQMACHVGELLVIRWWLWWW